MRTSIRVTTSASCNASGTATGSTSAGRANFKARAVVPHFRNRRSDDCCWCATMQGVLRGFHNTCRHRGAALCRSPTAPCASAVDHLSRTTRGFTICRGSCCAPPPSACRAASTRPTFPLYPISVTEWNGFVFVALTEQSAAVREDIRPAVEPARCLAPRQESRRRPRAAQDHSVQLEDILGELQRVPALPGRASEIVAARADLWSRPARGARRSRTGRRTAAERRSRSSRAACAAAQPRGPWTARPSGSPFPGLSEADREAGHIYMTALPSVFLVGHVDYVRVVRLLPLGPEQTELRVEYLFSPRDVGGSQVRPAQCRGFHEPRHDRGCRGVRTQSTRAARRTSRTRSRHAGRIRHPTIP